ncbi:MAG: 30S ribosomal protein S16 [Gemmatimonadaceae bacterium]
MAVRIRLRREGRKKSPYYRIVVTDSRSPRDGRFIEIIGQYQPRSKDGGLTLKQERAAHWLDNGATPSDTVRSLLRRAGVLKARHEARVARLRGSGAVPVSESADGTNA